MRRLYREHDQLGAGGNIASGIRTVRKGGRFKFDGFWFSHVKLEDMVGKQVRVSDPEDPFYNTKIRVEDLNSFLICYAKNEDKGSYVKSHRPKW